MPHLDDLDDLATTLGACNNVYVAPDGTLRGTNTDWRGVKGCLLNASNSADDRRGRSALIIGAGGASRAAIYALSAQLGCGTIYVINRDQQEVLGLLQDAKAHGARPPNVVHVRSREQARGLPMPFYIVGTVPDLEPKTDDELEARGIWETFLAEGGREGRAVGYVFQATDYADLEAGEDVWLADGEGHGGHWASDRGAVAALGWG